MSTVTQNAQAMPSLHERIAAAATGDAAAQNSLALQLLPDVRRLVHSQIERRLRQPGDAALARLSTGDIVQDVLLEVLGNLDRWDAENEDAFIGMLATLVEHRLADQLRYHRAGRRDVRRHGNMGAQTAGAADNRTPSYEAGQREQHRIYRQVLATFGERERVLLTVRLEDKLGFRAIAEQLNFPTADAARKAFQIVQARLAVRLAKQGLGPSQESTS